MARPWQVAPAEAEGEARELLDGVQQRLGMTLTAMRVMAASPTALGGYMSFSAALAGGTLDAKFREQIGLIVALVNDSDHCLFRHAALARRMGMSESEITACLESRSNDAKTDAGLKFVSQLALCRGRVNKDAVQRVRKAGYGEAEIVEIVANVAMEIFTNYFNHVAGTEVDFPKVSAMRKSNPSENGSGIFE
jgi:AhpD family alkylhydroperoxidase